MPRKNPKPAAEGGRESQQNPQNQSGPRNPHPAAEGELTQPDEGKARRRLGERRPAFGSYAGHGIRVDREIDRAPGQVEQRVFIHPVGQPFSEEEQEFIKAEGFEQVKVVADGDSFAKPFSPVNKLLADKVVNDILKHRGHETQIYIDPR